ncbi:hypothetical protein [Streptomyces sp. SYSU K217416]
MLVMANVFTVAELAPSELVAALAAVVGVAPADVDVADADGDQVGRNWDAAVLCGYHLPPGGDLAVMLDIYIADRVPVQPDEPELSRRLAYTGTTVLYPAESYPPSAYWAVTPDGLVTRARLEDSEDEDPSYIVDAVEAPVPDLPRAQVMVLEEILREERVGTPVTDAFRAATFEGEPGSDQARTQVDLLLWERLVRRLEADWESSGRYRADLYEQDLEVRDELERIRRQIPTEYAAAFHTALSRLDVLFRDHTVPGGGAEPGNGGAWWRHRTPRRIPWGWE